MWCTSCKSCPDLTQIRTPTAVVISYRCKSLFNLFRTFIPNEYMSLYVNCQEYFGLSSYTKYMNIVLLYSSGPCKYVTCSWNSWGGWSGTCGQMTRQRTSKVTQHVVNKPNCNGLQTTCPAPQTDSTFISCELCVPIVYT